MARPQHLFRSLYELSFVSDITLTFELIYGERRFLINKTLIFRDIGAGVGHSGGHGVFEGQEHQLL